MVCFQSVHDSAGHIHDQASVSLVAPKLSLGQDILQLSEHVRLRIGGRRRAGAVSGRFLRLLGYLGEEQRIRLRNHLSLFKYAGNVLDGGCGIGLIHISLIHQEFHIPVMGQGERYICLGISTAVPAAIPAMVLVAAGAHLGEMECLGIQPPHIAGYKRGRQRPLHQNL